MSESITITREMWDSLQERVRNLEQRNGKVATTAAAPAKQNRGHRLPDGWYPNTESIAQIMEEFPGVTQEHLVRQHRSFCDYWSAVPGQRGVKISWEATWRNWMRKSAQQGEIGGGTRLSTVDGRVDEAISRGLRLAALAREEEDGAHQAQLGED